jgi:hypothetical protein
MTVEYFCGDKPAYFEATSEQIEKNNLIVDCDLCGGTHFPVVVPGSFHTPAIAGNQNANRSL